MIWSCPVLPKSYKCEGPPAYLVVPTPCHVLSYLFASFECARYSLYMLWIDRHTRWCSYPCLLLATKHDKIGAKVADDSGILLPQHQVLRQGALLLCGVQLTRKQGLHATSELFTKHFSMNCCCCCFWLSARFGACDYLLGVKKKRFYINQCLKTSRAKYEWNSDTEWLVLIGTSQDSCPRSKEDASDWLMPFHMIKLVKQILPLNFSFPIRHYGFMLVLLFYPALPSFKELRAEYIASHHHRHCNPCEVD